MTVSAGARRHLIHLQVSAEPAPDGEGGYTDDWTDLPPSPVMAAILPATARDLERLMAGTVVSNASHIVTFPFHPGVTTKARIRFGARTFNVTGVANPEERNIETVCACQEIVP